MKFIFEDDPEDIISQFFMSAYPKDVAKKFIYAVGNAKIEHTIKKELNEESQEEIVVFLDMTPDNLHTIDIYRKLRILSINYSYKVIVLPLMCSEYYLIKSLYESTPWVIVDDTGIEICVNKDVWRKSDLLRSSRDIEFCSNFEKYCKLILIKSVLNCARHTGKYRGNRIGTYTKKEYESWYGMYYRIDCAAHCNKKQLDKAKSFLQQYPCVPAGSICNSMYRELDIDSIWEIHRRLVAEFNDLVAKYYSEGGIDKRKEILKIK